MHRRAIFDFTLTYQIFLDYRSRAEDTPTKLCLRMLKPSGQVYHVNRCASMFLCRYNFKECFDLDNVPSPWLFVLLKKIWLVIFFSFRSIFTSYFFRKYVGRPGNDGPPCMLSYTQGSARILNLRFSVITRGSVRQKKENSAPSMPRSFSLCTSTSRRLRPSTLRCCL
jgi:hypothetical protein